MYNSVSFSTFTLFCNGQPIISRTALYSQTGTLSPLNNTFPFLLPQVPGNNHWTSCLYEYDHMPHRNRIVQYMSVCDWLISLSLFSRFIQLLAYARMSFLLILDTDLLYTHQSAYPFFCRWALGWLPLLAVVSNAADTVGVQISVWAPAFISRIYSEVELLSHMVIPCFLFWRTVKKWHFPSGCTISRSLQQCTGLVSSHPSKHLLLPGFFCSFLIRSHRLFRLIFRFYHSSCPYPTYKYKGFFKARLGQNSRSCRNFVNTECRYHPEYSAGYFIV